MPRRRKHHKGGSALEDALALAMSLGRYAKDNRLISRTADSIGLGRKRGGSLLGDILSKITSIPAGLLIGATAGAQQAVTGLGRRRRGAGYNGEPLHRPIILQ
jgi:hypothetical protein